MPQLRRRLTVIAAGAALTVGPLATLAPSAASAPESTALGGDRPVVIMNCSVSRPGVLVSHQIPFPGRGKWRQVYEREHRCLFRNPRAKLKVISSRGAGSWRAIRKRVERAQSRPGFRLQQLHRRGAPFDSHTARTNVGEFTFRGANGKRQHVRLVGDAYTLLWVRSSQRAWKNGIGKTASRAHRGMQRSIAMA